jgi:hypothetical protein
MFSILKGWFGEKPTQFGMWLKLGDEYIRFHDVIVPAPNGTTQIDHRKSTSQASNPGIQAIQVVPNVAVN